MLQHHHTTTHALHAHYTQTTTHTIAPSNMGDARVYVGTITHTHKHATQSRHHTTHNRIHTYRDTYTGTLTSNTHTNTQPGTTQSRPQQTHMHKHVDSNKLTLTASRATNY